LYLNRPELPSIASTINLAKFFNKDNIKNNLVINRFNSDIEIDDVNELYGKKPIAILPEDPTVHESLTKQIPVYLMDKKAPFAAGIQNVVDFYSTASIKTDKK
jgi:MinD-like ATPase involved in chromosome partitioning or flagellar assembly